MVIKPTRRYKYVLRYNDEAPFGNEDCYDYTLAYDAPYGNESGNSCFSNPDDGWEKWSLPIGNSYFGANIFGRKKQERIQITENSLANPYTHGQGGICSFGDIYIDFNHENCENFERSLRIEEAVSLVEYDFENVHYKREYFASYPDRTMVMRFSGDKDKKLNCTVRAELAFLSDYLYEPQDNMGKRGEVTYDQSGITMKGKMDYYQTEFFAKIMVHSCNGKTEFTKDGIKVTDANELVLLFSLETNYKMESYVFDEPDRLKKLVPCPDLENNVTKRLNRLKRRSYSKLLATHSEDYQRVFNGVEFVVDGAEDTAYLPTDKLIYDYRAGKRSLYLEELYFHYGRYLLISSSRKGGYPANLQGTWSRYQTSPWSCGYWHNINVQMNYWPSFNTNMTELFLPYVDYFKAYFNRTKQFADEYVKLLDLGNYSEGNNGWTIGTGCWLYDVSGADKPNTGHSGPGTGGFTAKLFWDYYEFTKDKKFLEDIGYKAISEMARFLSKTLVEADGKYLVKYSASPEQFVIENGEQKHYHTTGCAFDQQMVWETYNDLIKAAKVLGKENDDIVVLAKSQIDKLDPVIIGNSGQIKEYREETTYGSIGEKHHRHISQLIGLYPGSSINGNNPEFLQAAKYTLNARGDESTGWSTAHKLNAWARIKDGKRSYDLLNKLIGSNTATNLWDLHPPFQIDGNFGGTAGIAEMLLQSHEGYIDFIPAIPKEWGTGVFTNLLARGNFEVNCFWGNKKPIKARILSHMGGICKVKGDIVVLRDIDRGVAIPYEKIGDVYTFKTRKNCYYEILFARPKPKGE